MPVAHYRHEIMESPMRLLALSALAICSLFVAGCGGGGGGGGAGDTTAPGTIANFLAADLAEAIGLTWTNPGDADLAGILVVVGEDAPVTFTPTNGMAYAAMDVVGPNQTVLSSGPGAGGMLPDIVPGLEYTVCAFAYDAALNYSAPTCVVHTNDNLGAQAGTISVDLGSGAVTVNSQPDNLMLSSPIAAVYNAGAQTLTIDLDVLNNANRLLFNLKALGVAVNEGTVAGPTMPFGGEPYTYYGPESLDVGANRTEQIVINGVTGATDPINLDLNFVDAPMVFGGNYGGDFTGFDTSLSGETFDIQFAEANDAAEQVRQAVIHPDGTFIYLAEKRSPFLAAIDTRTHTVTSGPDLSGGGGLGNIGGVAISPDGRFVYGVYSDGAHYHGGDGASGDVVSAPADVSLIEFDSTTLAETRRVDLLIADARTGCEIALSPDGAELAVLTSAGDSSSNSCWFIDVASMSIIDADPVTAGDQPVDLANGDGFAQYVVWATDGASVFVSSNTYNKGTGTPLDVEVINRATFATTTLTPTGHGESSSIMATHDGKLYYTTRNSSTSPLTVFDIAGATQSQPPMENNGVAEDEASAVVFDPVQARYYVMDDDSVHVMDVATDAQIDADNNGGNGMSILDLPEDIRAHFVTVSPF